jgi:hypothetical protein
VPTHRSFTLKRTSKLLSRIKPTSPMKKMNSDAEQPGDESDQPAGGDDSGPQDQD